MRTNIVIDDELVERAKRKTGLKTKREVVDLALRRLVAVKNPQLEGMLAVLAEVEFADDFDLKQMRAGREFPEDEQ